jgi:hypothetical protein
MEGLSSEALEDENLVQCWLIRSSTTSSLGIVACGDANAPSQALDGLLAFVLRALQARLTSADLRFAPEDWLSLMRG